MYGEADWLRKASIKGGATVRFSGSSRIKFKSPALETFPEDQLLLGDYFILIKFTIANVQLTLEQNKFELGPLLSGFYSISIINVFS